MAKPERYDFGGWATRNDLLCADGRTIRKDAFKDCDGKVVPLVWNHQHNSPSNILGHALLENREDGVYTYGSFNDTADGQAAKALVQHGDVESLSIYANKLQQNGRDVMHGMIREVSLVVAGANPGAFIDFVDLAHGEGAEEEVVIGLNMPLDVAAHADDNLAHADDEEDDDDESVQDIIDSMNEKQQSVMYALIGEALNSKENGADEDDETAKHSDTNSDKGENEVKHNLFEKDEQQGSFLQHSDEIAIINYAKDNNTTLQAALKHYSDQNDTLKHGFSDISALFPEYKNLGPAAPELVQRDQGWVDVVMRKVHKSPISRIRTRQMDARSTTLRGKGYNNRQVAKKLNGNMSLITRTTDPQTVYVKEQLHRDDIIDITDFDVVAYQYGNMRLNLNEEIATAIMIGDGREDGTEDKISEAHIRSILNDDDVYAIHQTVDIAGARTEIQGTDTAVHFSENYIYAEAIIRTALYSRELYKGTGTPDFYCTPHLVNVMLLARDFNGRRIYNDVVDLARALNVGGIYTAEQFAGVTRTTTEQGSEVTKNLLGIFVNLADYTVGSTKGGEITRFEDFDIDFNSYKYLMETRLSGALTRIASAIVLEENAGS